MKKLCPTCGGKGTINDPKAGGNMCYSGPNGEVHCQSCGRTGWIETKNIKEKSR